uniref:Uncharacterized protein n=1 Tax=Arundo donax TaxID=35708 RepID=A0A0A9CFU1_ARUDO
MMQQLDLNFATLCSWKLHEPHQECELVSHQMSPSLSLDQMGNTGNQLFFLVEISFYHTRELGFPALDDFLMHHSSGNFLLVSQPLRPFHQGGNKLQ